MGGYVVIDSVLKHLVESPKLNVIFAQLQRILSEGQTRLQHFDTTVREDEKSELINGAVIVQSPGIEEIDRCVNFEDYAAHGVR